jgi:glycosyltransferase involved in cell wall biosynthesis
MQTYDYTVVIPCLNEELTIAECIIEAYEAAAQASLSVEVIVADNGSSDKSVEIATENRARVLLVPVKGYGAALDAGIRAANSNLILMGDADCSYSFEEGVTLIEKLRDSNLDIVMGNRFSGTIEKGAMPWHHKYIGNPVLSLIGRIFFNIPIGDFHCGMRAFRKDTYIKANPITTGMEFATEIIAKFANLGSRFEEVPITLRKDKRNRKPHLRSFPDGWRHLKMMLLFSPQYFQLYPGLAASLFGFIGLTQYAAIGKINLIFAEGKVQAAIFSLVIFLIGLQFVAAAMTAMANAESKNVARFRPWDSLRRAIKSRNFSLASTLLAIIGMAGLMFIGGGWIGANTPATNPVEESQRTIPLVALTILGIQGLITSIQVRQILSKFW